MLAIFATFALYVTNTSRLCFFGNASFRNGNGPLRSLPLQSIQIVADHAYDLSKGVVVLVRIAPHTKGGANGAVS